MPVSDHWSFVPDVLSGESWYPPNHLRPAADWKLDEEELARLIH